MHGDQEPTPTTGLEGEHGFHIPQKLRARHTGKLGVWRMIHHRGPAALLPAAGEKGYATVRTMRMLLHDTRFQRVSGCSCTQTRNASRCIQHVSGVSPPAFPVLVRLLSAGTRYDLCHTSHARRAVWGSWSQRVRCSWDCTLHGPTHFLTARTQLLQARSLHLDYAFVAGAPVDIAPLTSLTSLQALNLPNNPLSMPGVRAVHKHAHKTTHTTLVFGFRGSVALTLLARLRKENVQPSPMTSCLKETCVGHPGIEQRCTSSMISMYSAPTMRGWRSPR